MQKFLRRRTHKMAINKAEALIGAIKFEEGLT
jgi:hypothetical protein